MQIKKLVWAITALVMAATLAACNLGKAPEPTQDVNAIYTSAAQTMIAALNVQQTQTAQAVTPTIEASPTALASLAPQATFAIATGSIPFGTPGTPLAFGTPGTVIPLRDARRRYARQFHRLRMRQFRFYFRRHRPGWHSDEAR